MMLGTWIVPCNDDDDDDCEDDEEIEIKMWYENKILGEQLKWEELEQNVASAH